FSSRDWRERFRESRGQSSVGLGDPDGGNNASLPLLLLPARLPRMVEKIPSAMVISIAEAISLVVPPVLPPPLLIPGQLPRLAEEIPSGVAVSITETISLALPHLLLLPPPSLLVARLAIPAAAAVSIAEEIPSLLLSARLPHLADS
ncbi:Hypothetical predicted protein, partial [Paramuricea clavata]